MTDTLREHGHFSKQMDGYPWFFSSPDARVKLFKGDRKIGLFDFYESLSCLSKINGALSQTLSELAKLHTPENGLA